MLMVKTKLGKSKLHGIGLFAAEFIPKGTVTWRFMPGLDLIVSPDTLLQLSEPARGQFLNYCYVDKYTKNFILCFDDERFINHSDTDFNIVQNNSESETEGVEIAARDIQEGEELICNYNHFDFDAQRKLSKTHIYSYTIEDASERAIKTKAFIDSLLKG